MNLQAISMGYAVPRKRFKASVHSTFRSAAYLKLDGGRGLLTLLASSEADLPQGIHVDTPQGFTFENLQKDEWAICRDGIIRFEKSPIVIDLRKALRWESNLAAYDFEPANPAVQNAWRFVWQALNDRQIQYGTEIVAANLLRPLEIGGSALFHRMADGIATLIGATARCDPEVMTGVSMLIGLGPGSTPAGDDLLVGYMAGLWCRTGEDIERKSYISNLGKTLIELSSQTTEVSRSYLYHSAFGQVSRRLDDLAEAICKGMDINHLFDRATAAMNVGHTSGMDAVMGLLLGLAAWDRDLLF